MTVQAPERETSPAPESIDAARLHERRERVFLVLAGLFLGTLAMLNILGISRFIVLGSIHEGAFHFGEAPSDTPWVFAVAIGVLPYPVTFICTDLISELYGRKRATFLVWVGLVLNLWVIFILWVGGALPGFGPDAFFTIRKLAFGAVTASMFAYLAAQFCDVYVFHFWKRLTGGRHLWLRNNGSTMVSQLVDTVAVIGITYSLGGFSEQIGAQTDVWAFLLTLIVTSYVFKFTVAMVDTIPIYFLVHYLGRYLRIDPVREHYADAEELSPTSDT